MTKKLNLEYFYAKGLLPFQAEFALDFLESRGKRYWYLQAPTGTGKTHLASILISQLLENASKKRVLVLAPALLLSQWKARLSDAVPAYTIVVDRKTYLELESQVPKGKCPWPAPAVILMSIDLAKRDDMMASLSTVQWDVVIFDECHLLVRKRGILFNRLMHSGKVHRTLLLSATPLSSSIRLPDKVIKRVIKLPDVIDSSGRSLFSSLEKEINFIYFERTKEEYSFLSNLQGFTKQLVDKYPQGKFQSTLILRAASSSIYATEGVLRRFLDIWRHLRNKIVHGVPRTTEDTESLQRHFSMFIDEPEVMENFPDSLTIHPKKFLFSYQKMELLLNQIEVLPKDSKMDALISYMKKSLKDNKTYYICILSAFPKTVQYLSSSLQDIGKPIFALTSAIELSERRNKLNAFRVNGGILILTDAALEGVTLEYVDECINYDLPINVNVFEQRQGRFLRLGRKKEFKMVVLRDVTKALSWEENLLKRLKVIFP